MPVVERPLNELRWGEYDFRLHRISLRPGLSRREARSTLAHEVQHAIRRDMGSPFGLLNRRQELAADREAALLLVDPAEYARAEAERDGHLPSMAFDLDVIPEVLTTWQGLILRLAI